MTNDPREQGSTAEDFTFVPYTHPEAPVMSLAEQRAWNDDVNAGVQSSVQGAHENLSRIENAYGNLNII